MWANWNRLCATQTATIKCRLCILANPVFKCDLQYGISLPAAHSLPNASTFPSLAVSFSLPLSLPSLRTLLGVFVCGEGVVESSGEAPGQVPTCMLDTQVQQGLANNKHTSTARAEHLKDAVWHREEDVKMIVTVCELDGWTVLMFLRSSHYLPRGKFPLFQSTGERQTERDRQRERGRQRINQEF